MTRRKLPTVITHTPQLIEYERHLRRKPTAASETGHEPRWEYDCGRCKFNWCCGPTCRCHIGGPDYAHLPTTPTERQREVDAALIAAGFQPEFRHRTLARLRDPS